jgi:hypothetical protein
VDSTTYAHAKAGPTADGGVDVPSLDSGNYTAKNNVDPQMETLVTVVVTCAAPNNEGNGIQVNPIVQSAQPCRP